MTQVHLIFSLNQSWFDKPISKTACHNPLERQRIHPQLPIDVKFNLGNKKCIRFTSIKYTITIHSSFYVFPYLITGMWHVIYLIVVFIFPCAWPPYITSIVWMQDARNADTDHMLNALYPCKHAIIPEQGRYWKMIASAKYRTGAGMFTGIWYQSIL